MLTQSRVTTILPVVNMERARRFYEDKLGMQGGESRPDGGIAYRLRGETTIELSPRKEATRNQYTAMGFEVEDVEGEVRNLETRGVRFEDYNQPDLKTVNHIARLGQEMAAWFKDTEGNILCIHGGGSSKH